MKILHLKKRYKIIFGILLFILILLFAAPRIARWYIVKNSKGLIGRDVSIDKIRINYFTGTIRIDDLALFEAHSKAVFLSFKRLKVNLNFLPLLKNEFYIKYISLDDPFIEILQDGEKFNFSDLLTRDTTTVVKDTVPAKPMKYTIENIRINQGFVKYTDVQLNHTIALDKFDLLIPGFKWNSDSTKLNVNFRFVDGGGLNSSLELNQSDSTYSVKLKIDSLNLDIIEPYVKSKIQISALHGYLSNDIKIKGNMRSIMQLFVKGINHVENFTMIDTQNRTILSFKDLTADIDSLVLDRNRVRLNLVSFTDPFILFEMIDSTNNWITLIKPPVNEKPDSLKKQNDTAAVAVGGSYAFSKLQILGGRIQFSDKTLGYPFDYNIDMIKVESAPVAGMKDKLNFKVAARLNSTANFSAEGILDPANFNDMDLALSILQFRMKDVDAYFKHYFGFPVKGGIMNFKTENKIRPASLISNNSLYFRKFTVAESLHNKVKYHVPLRLALAVLSDKDGIIDLKAPVETKGENVKVKNLGKIIFRIIGNLIVKAAVLPFNALAGSYNVDPAKLQEIQLSLTEAFPNEKNMKSVDVISDILNKKPGLNVDFYYCLDRKKAADSLAYMLAVEDYRKYSKAINSSLSDVADSILTKYLLGKPSLASKQDNPELKDLCRSYIGVENLTARLDSIKALQIGFMSNYLGKDKNLSSDRYRIIGTTIDTIRASGNFPAFRIYFTAGGEKNE